MNRYIEARLIDRDNIDYLIRNLEDIEKDRAVKSGLSAAGNFFASKGKSRLRQRMKSGSRGFTGNLLGSFDVRVKKRSLGVVAGFKQGTGGGSHAHLIDRGTDERQRNRVRGFIKGNPPNGDTGKVKGNRFWSDTEAQDRPQALDKLYSGIEKAVNRINNKR
jgi:hypothetical protein